MTLFLYLSEYPWLDQCTPTLIKYAQVTLSVSMCVWCVCVGGRGNVKIGLTLIYVLIVLIDQTCCLRHNNNNYVMYKCLSKNNNQPPCIDRLLITLSKTDYFNNNCITDSQPYKSVPLKMACINPLIF